MRWTGGSLLALIVSTGCTTAYDIRVAGHVTAPRVDARGPTRPGLEASSAAVAASDLEPVTDAIVSIAPRFGSGHDRDPAHIGPVDEAGAFGYASSGTGRGTLRGVVLAVKAPGFLPVQRFVPVGPDGRFDQRDLLVVLEDARRVEREERSGPVEGAPPSPPPR